MGIELVKNPKTLEPDAESALKIANRAKEHGLIIIRGGNWGNVLRVAPPYCISKEDVKFFLEVLEKCFHEVIELKIQ